VAVAEAAPAAAGAANVSLHALSFQQPQMREQLADVFRIMFDAQRDCVAFEYAHQPMAPLAERPSAGTLDLLGELVEYLAIEEPLDRSVDERGHGGVFDLGEPLLIYTGATCAGLIVHVPVGGSRYTPVGLEDRGFAGWKIGFDLEPNREAFVRAAVDAHDDGPLSRFLREYAAQQRIHFPPLAREVR